MRHLWALILILATGCGHNELRLGGTGDMGSPSHSSIINSSPSYEGQLTAGEWNDNDNWDFWTHLLEEEEQGWPLPSRSRWGLTTTERITVNLHNESDPVVDESVSLEDSSGQVLWESRTNNEGVAQLFPSLLADQNGPFTLTIGDDENPTTVDSIVFPIVQPFDIHVGAPHPEEILDLMFVVDTTGSMDDELHYLQYELADVISRSRAELIGDTSIRLSVNFYRDEGDEYVTRSFPFTSSISEGINLMADQSASGGGDYPEAVDIALFDAVHLHQWSESAQARLLFLVLDAPPHHTDSVMNNLKDIIMAASSKGIQIVPIAASGIDTETEFLLRSMDIATNGTYVFLTDDSGIGEEHLQPTIGQYTVEPLNDLLVDIITDAVQPATGL